MIQEFEEEHGVVFMPTQPAQARRADTRHLLQEGTLN